MVPDSMPRIPIDPAVAEPRAVERGVRSRVIKAVWLTAEWTRARLRPCIRSTWLYRLLQHPSKWLRRHADWRALTQSGIFCREEELAMCSLFPKQILDGVISELKPATLLDVGCGTGRSLGYFLQNGVDAIGIEGSQLAVARSENKDRIIAADLREPIDLGRRFDVVWCFEVVEHIAPAHVGVLVDNLTRHAETLVISHAVPGQGGEGHFNEQPSQYWIECFAGQGFALDERLTAVLRSFNEAHSQNMPVMRRKAGVQ